MMESPRPAATPESVHSWQQTLVDDLLAAGHIGDPRVEDAFREVARHYFLPDLHPQDAYRDEAIATKFEDGRAISSSSQPAIMALMLEQLAVEPGQRVLEIGAGTGYNAALLAHLTGPEGVVVAVDIDEDIVEAARAHLEAAGFDQVQLICGDGGLGHAPLAPYDRIILSVGAPDIAPAWIEQLKPGGRLVMPLSLNGPQKSIAFEKRADHLASLSLHDCGFMPLRGAYAGGQVSASLGPLPGLYLTLESHLPANPATIYEWLTGPELVFPTGVEVMGEDIWRGLSLWLALREPHFTAATAQGELAEQPLVPALFAFDGNCRSRLSHGLLDGDGLALLAPPAGTPLPWEEGEAPLFFMLEVHAYGSPEPAYRLIEHVRRWAHAGRPGSAGLCLRVYPAGSEVEPGPGRTILDRQWNRLVLDW
jgi:protein-L-isoaspartate(D-aspartate) O-methyltransferase